MLVSLAVTRRLAGCHIGGGGGRCRGVRMLGLIQEPFGMVFLKILVVVVVVGIVLVAAGAAGNVVEVVDIVGVPRRILSS